jgi:hypothetical protein
MPPTTWRTSNGGVIRRWHGNVTAEDQVASAGEFAELFRAGPIPYAIVDYRSVQKFEPKRGDIQRIADRLHGAARATRIAVIAPRDLIYGMARMFDLSLPDGSPWIIHVVRSVDEALAWLGEELPGVDVSEARAILSEFEQM